MKRIIAFFLLFLSIFNFSACADTMVYGSVVAKTANGDAKLDIMPQKVQEHIAIGETAVVTLGNTRLEMPFVDELICEDGKMQLLLDREDWDIVICVYNQSFYDIHKVDMGTKVSITRK